MSSWSVTLNGRVAAGPSEHMGTEPVTHETGPQGKANRPGFGSVVVQEEFPGSEGDLDT